MPGAATLQLASAGHTFGLCPCLLCELPQRASADDPRPCRQHYRTQLQYRRDGVQASCTPSQNTGLPLTGAEMHSRLDSRQICESCRLSRRSTYKANMRASATFLLERTAFVSFCLHCLGPEMRCGLPSPLPAPLPRRAALRSGSLPPEIRYAPQADSSQQ